jgi:hypothetical protein
MYDYKPDYTPHDCFDLKTDLRHIKDRILLEKKASMIIIDGGIGQGKTTLGIQLLEEYQDWEKIDFGSQYGMGGEDFQKKIKVCYSKQKIVVIYDEAGDFNKRGAMSTLNKQLKRIFEVYRAFRILVILILPNFLSLDSSLFENNIPQILINCYNRNIHNGFLRCFDMAAMLYMRDMFRKSRGSELMAAKIHTKIRPNSTGRFYNLSKQRDKELDQLSTQGKISILDEINIKNNVMFSMKELSNATGYTQGTIKQKLCKMSIKPSVVYNRKNYYDKKILLMLKNKE